MACQNCGRDPGKGLFCQYCGFAQNSGGVKPKKKRKFGKTLLFLALILLSLALIVGTISGNDSDNSRQPGQSASGSSSGGRTSKRSDSAELPDPGEFFDCNPVNSGWDSSAGCWKKTYKFAWDDNSKSAVGEYLDLLEDYNMESSETRSYDSNDGKNYLYYYFYNGSNEDVSMVADTDYIQAHVQISVHYNYKKEYTEVIFYYGDGFTVVDSGETVSYGLEDLS